VLPENLVQKNNDPKNTIMLASSSASANRLSGILLVILVTIVWSVVHCTDDENCFQIPYMMGYGGNFTILLPNGVTVFRYADAYNYDLESLVAVGMAIR
jgi:hypothetical protein